MKKINKKAITILTTFTTLFAFAGCKKSGPSNTTKPTPKPNTTTKSNATTKEDAKSYRITFNTNGGAPISTIVCTEGDAITMPLNPQKDGYDFAGWFLDAELETEFNLTTMPNHDITLYAKWETKEVTLTLVTFGGTEIDPITQRYNTLLEKPEDPIKEGHTFAGWYLDSSFENEFDFYRMPSKDTTIYAKYDVNQYTVEVETFGGTVIDSFSLNYGQTIIAPSAPEKEGCNFVGWFLDMELTIPFERMPMPAENITLYAKYEAKTNSISFISNGGTNVDTIIQDAGTAVTAPTDPTRFGYIFKGWYTEPGLINKYTFGTMPNDGIILYAKWEIINYTVVYHTNDGINSVYNPTTINISNNKNAISLRPATKQHYDFVGWYTTADFKAGTRLFNDAIPAMTVDTLDMFDENGELHLYAKYKYHDYKITYVTYGAINTNPSSSNISNEAITLVAPNRQNFVFIGWYTDADFDHQITEIPAHLDHDITIYARYDYENYNVTYNYYDQYGVIPSDAPTNPNPTAINIDSNFNLDNPSKAGYIFKGWYSSNTFTDENKVTKVEAGHTSGITLYAYFERITYTITYTDNIHFNNRLTYTVEDEFDLLDASKAGYDFDGWYIGSTKYTKVEKGTTGNLNFTPKFNIITYNITFITEGGSSVSPMTYTVDTDLELPASTYDGDDLRFVYWKNGNEILEAGKKLGKGRTGDLVLEAFYTDSGYYLSYYNYDGSKLAEIYVGNTDTPYFPYETPAKPYTDLYIYEFSGWLQEQIDDTHAKATAQFNEIQYLTFTKNSTNDGYTVKATPNVDLPENLILPTEYTEDGVTLPVIGIDNNGFRNGYGNVKTQNVKSIVIPEGYDTIGQYAFYNCTNVVEITLPKSLKTINLYSFCYMRKLETLNYNCESLNDVSTSGLFQYCGLDTEEGTIINIGADVTKIAAHAFNSNTSNQNYQFKVKEIVFEGDKCKEIGQYAFANTNIKDLILPDHIEVIGAYAFAYCYNLEKVYLPYNLKTNGNLILTGCNKISELTIPYIGIRNNGTLDNNYRFVGNLFSSYSGTSANNYLPQSLKKITLTNETSIGNSAFYNAQYVEEVTLNEEITAINSYAFGYTYRLKQLNYNCKNISDIVGISNIFYESGYYSTEYNVTFGKNVEHIPAYLFASNSSNDISYCPRFTNFIFDNECKVKSIGAYAFFAVRYCDEFVIPESVETIGAYAFAYSNFKTIKLNKLETISSSYGFSNMTKLENIYIDKNTKNFGSNLFRNSEAIKNIYYNGQFIDWMNNTYTDDYSNPMYYAKNFMIKVGSTYEKLTTIDLSSLDIDTINNGVFKGFETVTKIILPNSIKTIEDYAFSGMYRLSSINMPTHLEYIGEYAFNECYSIKALTLPNSLKEIDNYAFYGCANLASVTLPSQIESIGSYAFKDCTSLTSITLPSGLTSLPSGLFSGCSKLANVTLPEGLEVIPSEFFAGMTSLKNIILPSSLKTIEYSAFNGSGITEITIPASVEYINSYAFAYTASLEKLTIEEGTKLTAIPSYMFSHSSISELVIPSEIYMLQSNAFEYCTNLDNVDFSNIEYIGSYCFQYAKFKSLVIPEGVAIICSYAFRNCEDLEEITLPKSLKVIGSNAFDNTYNLKTVNWNCIELPYSYSYYFRDSSYPSTYYNYESGIFDYSGQNGVGITINIGEDVETLPSYFFYSYSSSYAPKIVKVNFAANGKLKNLTNYQSYGYDWDQLTSYAFGYVKYLEEIEIPGVDIIPSYFMYYTTNVSEVKLNEGTTYLDYYAFYGMGHIDNVYLPGTIERVNYGVFDGCEITNMYFNGTLEQLKNIEYANSNYTIWKNAVNFYYLEDGNFVKLEDEEVIEIIAQADIFDISRVDGMTFTEDAPLHIPSNIKKFKEYPFSNCTFECKNIYFDGTLEDWCKIVFDNGQSNPMSYADHFFFKEGNSYVEYTDLVIPSSITKINNYAFYSLKNVESLDLNNVTEIGENSFAYLYDISEINTKNVTKIARNAFYYCQNVSELTLGTDLVSVGDYAFYSLDNVTSLIIPGNVKKIGQYAFADFENLEEITISEGVEEIYQYAFSYTKKVKSLTIPGTVKTIRRYAFASINYIDEIIISEGVEKIERYAFDSTRYYLRKVVIPGTVKAIPYECFSYSSKLEEVVLGEGIEEIGIEAFEDCNKLTKINLPKSLVKIDSRAFQYTYYAQMKLNDNPNLKYIGEYAFYDCYCLTDVVLPETLEFLGQYAFYYCQGLGNIEINGTFDEVPYYACYGCYGLQSIKLGSNIKKIASYAFAYAYNLFSFTVSENIEEIGYYAFGGCNRLYVIYNDSDLEITIGSYDNGNIAEHAKYVLKSGDSYELMDENGFMFEYDSYNDKYYLTGYHGQNENITLPESFTDLDGNVITDFEIRNDAFQYNSFIKSVTIPNSYTKIQSNLFYYCRNLETVIIGSGVETIESNAFYESGLKSIVIPNAVTSLGSYAFYGCRRLTDITIGSGITEIPSYCFSYCYSLENITIPNTVETIYNNVFSYSKIKTIDLGNGVKSIGDYCFNYCNNLENIVIPESVESLGSNMFYECQNLKSFTILAEDAVLGYNMFYECLGLKEVTLTDNIKEIGNYCFQYCRNLKKITFGSGLEKVGENAFSSCGSLEDVVFNNGLEKIGYGAFTNTKLTSVVLPNSVTIVEAYAFSNCEKLISFKFSNKMTVVEYGLLNDCDNLENVDFNNALITDINSYAFSYDNKLQTINIPNTVTSIGDNAFYYCRGLNNVVLPNSLTYIGGYAFYCCSQLESIIIPDSVETISSYAFGYCNNLTSVSIGKNVKTIYGYAFDYCEKLTTVYYNAISANNLSSSYGLFKYASLDKKKTITIGKDVEILPSYIFSGYNSSYCSIDSIVFESGSNLTEIKDYAFYNNYSEFDIVLPNTLKTIGQYAFAYSHLKSVEMTNVESLGQYAFAGCMLEEVVLPTTCISVGNCCFDDNKLLKKATIKADFENTYTYYYNVPFYRCYALNEVIFDEGVTTISQYFLYSCTYLKKVTLPSTLTSIGSYAFYSCQYLDNVNLPENLETIGTYAFEYCYRLSSITLPESLTSIGNYAFYSCSSLYFVRNKSSLSLTIGNAGPNSCYVASYAIELVNGDADSEMFIYDNKYVFYKNPRQSGNYELVRYVGDSSITEISLPVPSDEFVSQHDEKIPSYSIRAYAFDGVKTLKKIVISEGVTAINNYAFSNMENLEELTIGKDVKTIGSYAFNDCRKLKTINYNAINVSSNNYIFTNAGRDTEDGVTVNFGKDVAYIAQRLFDSGNVDSYNKITKVNFDSDANIVKIYENAFNYCKDLKSIVIPNTVTTLSNYAFSNCTSLEEITLPNQITYLAQSLFSGCTSLKSITIPNTVEYIYNYAFYNCTSLEEIVIPGRVSQINNYAFYNCEKLASVQLNNIVTTIGYYCFYNCKELTSIVIPNTVTSLGYNSFQGCSKLSNVTLSESLTTISSNLFQGCTSLEEINIPDTVKTIDSYAFSGCTNLVSVHFPNQLTKINNYAFYNCSSLDSAILGGAVDTIGSCAFYQCYALREVTVASPKLSIGPSAFYYCNDLETFDFNGDITSLGYSAFSYCSLLKEIHLGNELTSIPESAFNRSGLESIIIPDTVTNIQNSAFYFCKSLTNITLSNNIMELTSNVLYGSNIEELIIPEGVTTIASNAISYLPNLKVLYLPTTLKNVGNINFDYSKLEEVHIGVYYKDMNFSSDYISYVYVNNEEVAEYLLYEGSFNKLIKNTMEIYIESTLTVTDYVSDNYSYSGTVTVDDITYKKYTRN